MADVPVLKVKYEGCTLILTQAAKDVLWDYFEDWDYEKVELTFTTMPQEEVDALDEFEGFP